MSSTRKKKSLNILQVRMAFVDNAVYHPVKLGEAYQFMKLIKGEGYLSLYTFQIDNRAAYEGEYLLKRDGSGTEIPNLLFKKSMMKFLAECPEVISQIDKGTLGRGDVPKIIDAFNECIESNTKFSVSQKPIPTTSMSVPELWTSLEYNVKISNVATKQDAIEMIVDIKSKISRGEKIPKFLIEGLKSSLSSNQELTDILVKALESINY